jgi:hypothetical protein
VKRPSSATILFAVLAVIGAAVAVQARSGDTDAGPAAVPAARIAPAAAPAPTATQGPAAQPPAAHPASQAATRPVRHVRRAPRRPALRFSLPSNRALAAQDCREESFDDAAEFRFAYGTGQAAIRRCARVELSKARADCRADEVEDPFDYRAEHGAGAAGLTRCVRDSLT